MDSLRSPFGFMPSGCALRASVGGGFLASLVTPMGRLWRPNWATQFAAPRMNCRHADFQFATLPYPTRT